MMGRVKLLLRQISSFQEQRRGPKRETFEYEGVETSDARWGCGQILDRSYVKDLSRRTMTNVRIISGD